MSRIKPTLAIAPLCGQGIGPDIIARSNIDEPDRKPPLKPSWPG